MKRNKENYRKKYLKKSTKKVLCIAVRMTLLMSNKICCSEKKRTLVRYLFEKYFLLKKRFALFLSRNLFLVKVSRKYF